MKSAQQFNSAAPSSPKILIVDDDLMVSRAMDLLMSKAGFRPVVCNSAEDALKRSDSNISAAIVDIHLPDMNGLALSQQLRERLGPATPIVILSGDNSIDTIRALPDAGATYFFAKPVNGGRLVEHLKQWIAETA